MKNYGFNPILERKHAAPTDWVRGGVYSIPCIGIIVEGERDKYLPLGEIQNKGMEKQDCVTRAVLNVLEGKLTYLLQNKKLTSDNEEFLRKNNYIQDERVVLSDRYLAIKSETSPIDGNSMKKVIDTVYRIGLIPKSMFPQVDGVYEYYDINQITPQMELLAQDFKSRFTLNYEKVWQVHFNDTIEEDIIITAAYAWTNPINGEYPAEPTYPFNHCFIIYKRPKYYAFDNYIDGSDGDFIKKLASDYQFMNYGYRIAITSQNDVKKKTVNLKSIWQWFITQKLIYRIFKIDLINRK